MKKGKDVKFIIYQALYIFVVCVVAMKNATLDLTQVISDDGKVRAEISPDSLEKLMKILERSIIVDTNLYVIISKTDLEKMDDKIKDLVIKNQPQISLTQTTPSITNPNISQIEKEEIKEKEKEKDPGEMKEIRIGNIQLTQFTENTLNNPYDTPLEIEGITTIPPKSSKTFITGGQSSVVIRVGGQTKSVSLKPNEKPRVSFQKMAVMGEDARVSQLQSTVGFRVTVTDDFPGQLDIKVSGPVTSKVQSSSGGTTTIDITLNAFSSKGTFDNFTDNKNAPYSVGFTVTVKDKISGHSVTGQNSFMFGEW